MQIILTDLQEQQDAAMHGDKAVKKAQTAAFSDNPMDDKSQLQQIAIRDLEHANLSL